MRQLLFILCCCFAFNSMAAETFTNSLGMTFVKINASENSEAENQVDYPFWIGQTEITQEQWQKVMRKNPSYFKGEQLPVEMVNYRDVVRFLKKLNKLESKQYRLPTEREWEYAARAGTTTLFYTGECITTDQANFDGKHPSDGCEKGKHLKKTVDVASYEPNAWGLHDMHGNVWEWTCSLHDKPYSKECDPDSEKGKRVLRGGGWNDNGYALHLGNRAAGNPKTRFYIYGFRVVLPVSETEEK